VFRRVTLRVSDLEASERFYDTVLPALGIDRGESELALEPADGDHPATHGLHIGFAAPSHDEVEAFWRAGTEAGYRDDGEPGPRPQYRYDYYGAFLLDPDGNSAEGVHHGAMRRGGAVDHLWIRVADVGASKRFYDELAPAAGFRLGVDTHERVQFLGEEGSFSLVAGRPSENVRMTFGGAPAGVRRDPDGNTVEIFS
jgi:catechol 2,3-dioxygenase-like lactoylglutathione lyase family enzyme